MSLPRPRRWAMATMASALEIIDADMDDLGRQVTVFSFGVHRISRQADKIEGRPGTQAAHGAPANPSALPGFSGFHGETAVAFGFTCIGPGIEARVIVAFEEGCGLADTRAPYWDVEADVPFGLVIVADRTEQVLVSRLCCPKASILSWSSCESAR